MLRASAVSLSLVPMFLGLVVACSAEAEGDDLASQEDDLTSAPIAPATLLSCWVDADTSTNDPFFQLHSLSCADRTPSTYPLRPSRFVVETFTAKRRSAGEIFDGGEKRIARLRSDDFPVELKVRLMFPNGQSYGSSFTLKQALSVGSLGATSKAAPIEIKSPFTLWPVELKNETGRRFFVSGTYEVPTAPFKVGANFTIPDDDPASLSPRPFVDATATTTLAFVAPARGGIDVRVNGQPARIEGPGTYVVTGNGLRKEDDAAPRPPPTPVVPAPTCGVEGLAPCAGNVCAPEHRLDAGRCVACGTDGKPFCRDDRGNPVCSSGHRVDATTAKCLACGANGQTFCRDERQNPVCNTGHRYDATTAKCLACGSDGQTFCRDDRGNPVCDAGHRYDATTAKCLTCGGDGQTFCRDGSANPICNPGHRYDSGTAKCRVCGGDGQTFCRDTNGSPICQPGLRYDASSGTCKR